MKKFWKPLILAALTALLSRNISYAIAVLVVSCPCGHMLVSSAPMIAALAVKRGELQKADLATFPVSHGLTGWAPTQGHIPSGVPYIGFARNDIMAGKINRVMIIGKGSLFLGRMTNLFDGVSFVIQANTGAEQSGVSEEEVKGMIAKAMKDFAATLLADAQ